jgi:AAA domain, putative AbiEii toxin, Type IV TA system
LDCRNYLIDKPIDLMAFASGPPGVSIPLRNCFLLAGIEDIPSRITSLEGDSTEIELLSRELGESVTKHLSQAWPNHPVEITFLITGSLLNFHVRDLGTNGKAKTADQRSDGFRQFVSFLLTVSAQNKNEELSKTILLLDEPETHLHPLAQEYLLRELVALTANDRDNVAVFATHSNYLIDKTDLSRNHRVTKEGDRSHLVKFDKKSSTYASVSFEVFSIPSTDYHNELYGMLHERFQNEDIKDESRERIKIFDEVFLQGKHSQKRTYPYRGKAKEVTLPTYVRNCIHHPESGQKFSEEELSTSIKLMRTLL